MKVLRAAPAENDSGIVRALDPKGLPLGEAPFAFKGSDRETEAVFDLPVEIRNDIARLEVAGERSSGAVQLLDKRWRRRTIGVITGATADTAQPLLASTYYLSRALNPFADVRIAERGSPTEAVRQFMAQNLPMLILADVGNVAEARERLTKWIDDGGVLVRFAGPRLAAADDDLVPVKLRRGGRTLGGSLSWEQPQQLAAFARESPFNGMPVPNDVTVTRQVLAEPDSGLTDRTWATLADGTPLVTAARRGKGLIVLFHVTADTRWSDLPLSGAFVEMLKRIVALAGSNANAERVEAQGARESAADPRARRFWRVRAAAFDGAAGAGGLQLARDCRSSARILRATGRAACREYAQPRRPPHAARLRAALGAPRSLSSRRAEGSARADLPRRAGAAGDRRAGGVLARRRADAADAAAARGGRMVLFVAARPRCVRASHAFAQTAGTDARPAPRAGPAAKRPIRRPTTSPRRSRPKRGSPTSSPAMPRSTTSARPACRG